MTSDNINRDNLDSWLEYAIAAEGAKVHLLAHEKERAGREIRKRLIARYMSYAAAACLLLVAGASLKLSSDARSVGLGFVARQYAPVRGTSEIEALIIDGKISDARKKIASEARRISAELENPMYDDEAYISGLQQDAERLHLLDAVCRLRQGRFLSARRALRKISAGGGSCADAASELLEKL